MANHAVKADNNARGVYDQILVDVVTYVYHHNVDSSRAWQQAKLALLDALGCVLETLQESEEAHGIIGPVVKGTTVPDGFKLPGTPYQLDPLKGAFDLGTLIRYLDHNDAYPGAEWGHPSDNIGAILAVADWLSRSSKSAGSKGVTMDTVLLTLIKAYEIQGCFQIRNAFNQVGLDHTLLVKVASTVVTSWLLGLSEVQALDALSQAWMDSAPLRVFRQSPNTGPRKGWAAGDACMRAVHLALLTKSGQPGAPTVLTTPRWGFYAALFKDKAFELPQPFGSWVVESIFFKIHATEGHGASAAEAALEVYENLRRHGRSVDEIAHIHVRTHQAAMIIINKQGALHNPADRDHCMQYLIAVILWKGNMIAPADYQDKSPWAKDTRVEALGAKIDLVEEAQFTADYHDKKKRSASSALTVTLKDGTKMDEILVEYPTGHPWRKETPIAVRRKFRENVAGHFGDGEKAERILRLEDLNDEAFRGMQVRDFVDLFAGD